jgi:hypothetical protein
MDSIRSLVYPQVGVAVDKGATANKCGVTGNLASALRWVAGTLLFAVVLLCSQRANAQNTGTIFGSVQDPTGAVIPGARRLAYGHEQWRRRVYGLAVADRRLHPDGEFATI